MKKTVKIAALLLMAVVAAFSVGAAANFNAHGVYAAVVKQGSKGETVKKIQQKLKNWGYYTGAVDGIFGAKTTAAVKLFQKRNGLVADGIAGSGLTARLHFQTDTGPHSVNSHMDRHLLLCHIH